MSSSPISKPHKQMSQEEFHLESLADGKNATEGSQVLLLEMASLLAREKEIKFASFRMQNLHWER